MANKPSAANIFHPLIARRRSFYTVSNRMRKMPREVPIALYNCGFQQCAPS